MRFYIAGVYIESAYSVTMEIFHNENFIIVCKIAVQDRQVMENIIYKRVQYYIKGDEVCWRSGSSRSFQTQMILDW